MKSKKRARTLVLAGIIPALVLLSMACNLSGTATEAPAEETSPTAASSEDGEVNPTQPPQEQVEPTQPAPPAATPTPVPDVPGPSGCTLNGAYVADVTIPDGTEIPPSKPFVKAWRMRNTGTCPWKAGTKLVFVSGDQMETTSSVAVGPVAPGDGTKISVNMTAPSASGTYKGNWQLQSPDGTNYGSTIYVEIVVPPAPAPTATPGGNTPPSPTPAPSGPQETTIFVELDADNSGSGGSGGMGSAKAGDDPNDSRVIAYLSWDLSSIPVGAEIVSAKIHWGTQCFRGGDYGDCSGSRNAFPALGNDRLGYLEIRHYPYGDMSNPPAAMLNPSLVSPFQVYSSQPTGTLDVTDQVDDDFGSGDDFQLRITFENGTYESGIGNGITFVEGTDPNKLEVVYRMP